MSDLRIEITGFEDLAKRLERIKAVDAYGPTILQLWSIYMLEIIKTAFNTSTDPVTGQGWKPLADSTLESVHRGKLRSSQSGGRPLLRTTQLLASMAPVRISKDNVEVGTTLPYGVYHNSDKPRRRLPMRRFMGWRPDSPKRLKAIAVMVLREEGILK